MPSTTRAALIGTALLLAALPGALGARRLVLDDRLLVPLGRAVSAPLAPAGNDAGLAALRQLRDPELQPLFGRLAASPNALLRRHGILGLAEIETPARLRPMLLSTTESDTERAFILGEALGAQLLADEDIETLLEGGDLDPFVEVALRSSLQGSGRAPGVERLRELAEDPAAVVAAPALLLLCTGGESGAAEKIVERVAGMQPSARGAVVAVLLEQVRRDGLRGCSEVFARVREVVKDDPIASLDALRAWLHADAKSAAPVWRAQYEGASELSAKLRTALIGLEASPGAPAEMFAPVAAEKDSELLRAIGGLAQASASGEGMEKAIATVAPFMYPPVEAWLVERLPLAHEEAAPGAWRAIIGASAGRESSRAVTEGVATATERLASVDAKFVQGHLEKAAAANDRVLCQAILTGMLRATPAPAWDSGAIEAWPDRTTAALALVVAARCDPAFAEDDVRVGRLVETAVSRSGLPEAMRIQAAWLAARIEGNGAEAIASVAATLPQ